jgi:hypothetical protein
LSGSEIRVGAWNSFQRLPRVSLALNPGYWPGLALLRDHRAGLPFARLSAITPPPRCPAEKGCRGGGEVLNQHARTEHHREFPVRGALRR